MLCGVVLHCVGLSSCVGCVKLHGVIIGVDIGSGICLDIGIGIDSVVGMTLHGSVLLFHSIVLHVVLLYCIVLYCIVLFCVLLHGIGSGKILEVVVFLMVPQWCALCCFALFCVLLHCVVLCCFALVCVSIGVVDAVRICINVGICIGTGDV